MIKAHNVIIAEEDRPAEIAARRPPTSDRDGQQWQDAFLEFLRTAQV